MYDQTNTNRGNNYSANGNEGDGQTRTRPMKFKEKGLSVLRRKVDASKTSQAQQSSSNSGRYDDFGEKVDPKDGAHHAELEQQNTRLEGNLIADSGSGKQNVEGIELSNTLHKKGNRHEGREMEEDMNKSNDPNIANSMEGKNCAFRTHSASTSTATLRINSKFFPNLLKGDIVVIRLVKNNLPKGDNSSNLYSDNTKASKDKIGLHNLVVDGRGRSDSKSTSKNYARESSGGVSFKNIKGKLLFIVLGSLPFYSFFLLGLPDVKML
ncbi:hypothetical protein AX774_g6421 [Zancudomyces culisetae]|uniref:Uncharacterized protein n=1 Tax=Zancudomyces culisetae TaxID=1213189 RepID=A0A1R1PGP7_ZANCU|nr:hypothetical protein AX774_g6421 [Zancudomyces culisetae]|eukprot:OMH80150.1 hypothetical protein AX774_g6421 [Zancudomyces culisetae]